MTPTLDPAARRIRRRAIRLGRQWANADAYHEIADGPHTAKILDQRWRDFDDELKLLRAAGLGRTARAILRAARRRARLRLLRLRRGGYAR